MQSKSGAVDLIRKFQQLFKDLNQKQIAERLIKLVMAKPVVSRAVLVVDRDDQLMVETVGTSTSDKVVSLSRPMAQLQHLPADIIRQSFVSGKQWMADIADVESLTERDYLAGTRSILIYPILDSGKPIGAFYCESPEEVGSLIKAANDLETVWVFSTLLIRQLIEMRHHEEQAEKYRVAEQALWASETYLKAILYHSPTLISVKDLDGNVILASEYYKQLMAVDEDEGYVGKNVFDVFPVELARELWQEDQGLSQTSQNVESELEIMHKDGSLHTYLMVKFPLKDKSEKVFGICSICTDITERKQAEDALREQQSRLNYMAFHDALTGLPNRALFYDRLNHGLARAKRSGGKLVAMLLDLDRFKYINDSLGHDAGDLLLKAISQRLKECVRDMDTVARVGGDEFVVVLEGIHDIEDVGFVAQKILATISRPINIQGHDISTTVSIGISVYPDDGTQADELLKTADIAMYKAKESGKNNYQFYAEGMNASAVNFLLLENDLRRAIEQDQLTLYYQPQFDLQTDSLVGMEALVRWQHPERGLVSPAHFIPLAEETGLIVPLSEWVLRRACEQQKIWLKSGRYAGKVAVNLSPRQFRQSNFPERVAEILADTGLPATHLELEITESSAMEHASETINMMNVLNQMGISLAIDDFGTGYSSLAYLKRFPIHKLKIDRSFICDVATNQNDAAIAKSIINLAHNMSLNVVAEGVEYDDQATWLRERGCDQVQGFFYAKPMSAEQIEQHLVHGGFDSDSNVVRLELA
jgi:diguanylate cyclase (GGDEF)-like protein/PAS domain S-box-containing protein